MVGPEKDKSQSSFLFNDLRSQLNPKRPMYQLSERMPWGEFERDMAPLYASVGRPGKPIRLMVSLVILKHLFDLSDEAVVEQWVENPYWQFFSGMEHLQWKLPCDPSELVYFRRRIGTKGVEKILQISILMQDRREAQAETVILDTTVQEKAITHPHDSKLYRRVAEHCVAIAKREGIHLRQPYTRVMKRLRYALRNRNFPRARKQARKAIRKLRIIAGRLVRELSRKMTSVQRESYAEQMTVYQRIIAQKPKDKNKVYSVHEPQVYCVGKGKDHKQYEFGTKVSLAVTPAGVIVGALNLATNQYDGDTVAATASQVERVTGQAVKTALTDRGYRKAPGSHPAGIDVITPYALDEARKMGQAGRYRWLRRQLRRRSMIEPIIGHLKSDHRLCRNLLKGWLGDEINVMLAAAAFNFRRILRKLARIFSALCSGTVVWRVITALALMLNGSYASGRAA